MVGRSKAEKSWQKGMVEKRYFVHGGWETEHGMVSEKMDPGTRYSTQSHSSVTVPYTPEVYSTNPLVGPKLIKLTRSGLAITCKMIISERYWS